MNATSSVIQLSRDVDAIQIPSGTTAHLSAGSSVVITQDLGGTYTIVVEGQSGLYRILDKDADALGKTSQIIPSAGADNAGPLDEAAIWNQLKTCYDPEIPVNIVDLGLIYSLEVKPVEGGGHSVEVKMTLTAPGCGMGPSIASDAQSKILSIPGITEARVDVVWDPPWSSDRISQDGKAKLGMA